MMMGVSGAAEILAQSMTTLGIRALQLLCRCGIGRYWPMKGALIFSVAETGKASGRQYDATEKASVSVVYY
jgi:hypothetical protein